MYLFKIIRAAILLAALAHAATDDATKAEEGQELFNKSSCMECHNKSDFGGEKSKARTYQHIKDYTDACQINNDALWFEEDVENVAEYLNNEHYKLKK